MVEKESETKNAKERSTAKSKSSRSSKGRFYLKLSLFILASLPVLLILSYCGVKSYVSGETFRAEVESNVSKALGGDASISDLNWEGWDLSVDQLNLISGKGLVKSFKIHDVETGLLMSSIREDSWNVPKIHISQAEMSLGEEDEGYVAHQFKKPSGLAGLLPHGFNWQKFEVSELDVSLKIESEEYAFQGVRLNGARKSKSFFDSEMTNGKILLPFEEFSELELIDSGFSVSSAAIEFYDANVTLPDDVAAKIDLTYDWVDERLEVKVKTEGVDIKPYIEPSLLQNISGRARLDFKYTQDKESGEVTTGSIDIEKAELKSLPILDVMSKYLVNSRYQNVKFDTARCEIEIKGGDIYLDQIHLEERGKVCLVGSLLVREDESIEGEFEVGLPKSVLGAIPGAEKHVFLAGRKNLNWAKMKVSGNLDSIEENLTDQLIRAAIRRISDSISEQGLGALESIMNGEAPVRESLDHTLGTGLKIGNDAFQALMGEGLDAGAKTYSFNGIQFSLAKPWRVEEDSSSIFKAALIDGSDQAVGLQVEVQKGVATEIIEKRFGKNVDVEQFLSASGYSGYYVIDQSSEKIETTVYCILQAGLNRVVLGEVRVASIENGLDKQLVQFVRKWADSVKSADRKLLDVIPIDPNEALKLLPF